MSIDGTAGKVYAGQVKTAPSEIVAGLIEGDAAARKSEKFRSFQQLMTWCSQATRMSVRTNADTPEQAANAIAFGAVGIGLTRTEHMFFEGDRIDAMREMILAETIDARKTALAKLFPYQRDDFAGIFRALKGYPATIRFLDPPLHEFLPHTKEQQAELAKKIGVPAARIHQRVEQLHEFNPMLGFRGCRLGIGYPEISAMQARAVFEAAAIVQKEGIKVKPEIMIPLAAFKKELDLQVAVVHETAKAVQAERKVKIDYLVGTMIEIPRGALTATKSPRRRSSSASAPTTYADRARHVARRFGLVPAAVSGSGDRHEEPVRDNRRDGRRPARGHRRGEGPQRASRHQARDLRRARRRPGVVGSSNRSGSTT